MKKPPLHSKNFTLPFSSQVTDQVVQHPGRTPGQRPPRALLHRRLVRPLPPRPEHHGLHVQEDRQEPRREPQGAQNLQDGHHLHGQPWHLRGRGIGGRGQERRGVTQGERAPLPAPLRGRDGRGVGEDQRVVFGELKIVERSGQDRCD